MAMISLIKLTENDKRLFIALLIIVILLLILVGYIVLLIKRTMKRQGKAIDTFMFDLVDTKVVDNTKHFRKVASARSRVLLFKQARKPMLLFVIAIIIIGVYMGISKNTDLRVLFSQDEGFASLFYTFDWKGVPRATLLGIHTFIPEQWPPVTHTPHFLYDSFSAWVSYVTVPLLTVGAIMYMVNIQAFIARALRIRKMSVDVYTKNLDNIPKSINN